MAQTISTLEAKLKGFQDIEAFKAKKCPISPPGFVSLLSPASSDCSVVSDLYMHQSKADEPLILAERMTTAEEPQISQTHRTLEDEFLILAEGTVTAAEPQISQRAPKERCQSCQSGFQQQYQSCLPDSSDPRIARDEIVQESLAEEQRTQVLLDHSNSRSLFHVLRIMIPLKMSPARFLPEIPNHLQQEMRSCRRVWQKSLAPRYY
jgi:hypothetical protein